MDIKEEYVNYLELVWSKNKAKGLTAQIRLEEQFSSGDWKKHAEKTFSGCWLLSPKSLKSYKKRHAFFVHNKILKETGDEINPQVLLGNQARPFYGIAEFLRNAGFKIIYAIPLSGNGRIDFEPFYSKNYESIKWNFFEYQNEQLVRRSENDVFDGWTRRGMARYRKDKWENDSLRQNFLNMTQYQLDSLVLNELFYTGYLKSVQKKSADDPYDVDSFLISLSQKHIFPVELKEKFPVLTNTERYFGIDAGRILMMMRICIPNDSNGLYLIREMNGEGTDVVGWKYMTLSKMIMTSSWNLQAGGRGMGGGDTQTVKLPYDEFETITESTFDEDNLKKISDLPRDVKDIVLQYKKNFI